MGLQQISLLERDSIQCSSSFFLCLTHCASGTRVCRLYCLFIFFFEFYARATERAILEHRLLSLFTSAAANRATLHLECRPLGPRQEALFSPIVIIMCTKNPQRTFKLPSVVFMHEKQRSSETILMNVFQKSSASKKINIFKKKQQKITYFVSESRPRNT